MAERDRRQHQIDAREFFRDAYETFPRELRKALNEAVYAADELGLWYGDFDLKDADLATQIWALVETVRRTGGFPPNLRM